MASCHLDQGSQEAALHHGKAAIDLARQHGYQEEGIRLIEEILVIAEAADRSEEHRRISLKSTAWPERNWTPTALPA